MDIIKELGRTSEGLIAPDHGCDERQNPAAAVMSKNAKNILQTEIANDW